MNENEKQVEETDEVEGHGVKGPLAPEETDEVEGHAGRFTGALPEEGDDEGTEGHAGSRNF